MYLAKLIMVIQKLQNGQFTAGLEFAACISLHIVRL